MNTPAANAMRKTLSRLLKGICDFGEGSLNTSTYYLKPIYTYCNSAGHSGSY